MDYELDEVPVTYKGKAYFAYGTVGLDYSEHEAQPDIGCDACRELEGVEVYDDCYLIGVEDDEEISIEAGQISEKEFAELLDTPEINNDFVEAINDAIYAR